MKNLNVRVETDESSTFHATPQMDDPINNQRKWKALHFSLDRALAFVKVETLLFLLRRFWIKMAFYGKVEYWDQRYQKTAKA
jgi:hypothetical protein